MRKAILITAGLLLFPLGAGAGVLASRNPWPEIGRAEQEPKQKVPKEGGVPMPTTKSLDGMTDLTEDALTTLYASMSWSELCDRSLQLDSEREILLRVMDDRGQQIQHIDSLSIGELERYVRNKQPDWQYAKGLLEEKRKG